MVRAKRGVEDELQSVEVDVGCLTTDYAMQVNYILYIINLML